MEAGVKVQLLNGRYDPLAFPLWASRVARHLHCDVTFTGVHPSCHSPFSYIYLAYLVMQDCTNLVRLHRFMGVCSCSKSLQYKVSVAHDRVHLTPLVRHTLRTLN